MVEINKKRVNGLRRMGLVFKEEKGLGFIGDAVMVNRRWFYAFLKYGLLWLGFAMVFKLV